MLFVHSMASAPFKAAGVFFTAIDEIFDHLGPTPRLCFGNTRSLIDYRRKLDEALGILTLGGLEELVRLFNRYIRLPSTRRMAGDVFEAYCHIIFSTRIKFEFIPMVRIGGHTNDRGAKEPQWHSSHTKFPESTESKVLEALRVEASSKTVSLSIDPSRVVDYSTDKVTDGIQVEADVYYIPLKANQAGIDSFILHNDTLYLFQMTTFAAYDIKEKLVPFLLSLKGTPSRSRWHFIFVKPSLHILACPVPKCTVLQDLVLYSAEVEVES
jgi:hypothetical protein